MACASGRVGADCGRSRCCIRFCLHLSLLHVRHAMGRAAPDRLPLVALGTEIVGNFCQHNLFELWVDNHDRWMGRHCWRGSFDLGWRHYFAACTGEAIGSGASSDSTVAIMIIKC